MDTTSTTEEIDLEEIIQEVCTATGRLDYDMIIAQATKNISPQALVRQCVEEYPETITRHLFENHEETLRELIEDCEPEEILREVIDDLITAEDHLVYRDGVTPEAARCLVALSKSTGAQDRAEAALISSIESDLDAACQRVWDETHETENLASAAGAMMAGMPAFVQACRNTIGSEVVFMTERFAEYYAGFLAERQQEA